MSHDDAANESRTGSPAALLRVHQIPSLVQELSAERFRKVVPQVVTGTRLRTCMCALSSMHSHSRQRTRHERPVQLLPLELHAAQG